MSFNQDNEENLLFVLVLAQIQVVNERMQVGIVVSYLRLAVRVHNESELFKRCLFFLL